MRVIKKIVAVLLIMSLCVISGGCKAEKKDGSKNYKLNIVTTLFPYYDMARAVIGDVEGIHLSMTVAPGQDSHSFEPTPTDVININKADLFIYNGGTIETWVDTLIDSLNNKNQTRMKMMSYVDTLEEEHVEGMDTRFDSHDEEEEQHHSEEETEVHSESEHSHEEDEHIWTSPVNEQILIEKICNQLCESMPEKSEDFRKNTDKYIKELKKVDSELHNIVDNARINEIIFADKFPILYFAREYGLKYYAAFPGCGSDMEPSAKTIAFLIDKIKQDKVKAVFYLELSSHAVADAISEDTGAVKMKFNSCHNITQKQFDEGVTYIDLMQENINNLKKALK